MSSTAPIQRVSGRNPLVDSNMSLTYQTKFQRDFEPLEAASKVILTALREDESSPHSDLYRRLTLASTASSSSPSSSMSPSSSNTSSAMALPSHVYFPPSEDSVDLKHPSRSKSSNDRNFSNSGVSGGSMSIVPSSNGNSNSTSTTSPTKNTNMMSMSSPWAHISSRTSGGAHTSTSNNSSSNYSDSNRRIGGTPTTPNGMNTTMGVTHTPTNKSSSSKGVHFQSDIRTATPNIPRSSYEYHHSIPLPSHLAKLVSSVRLSSLMGLLPEANLAWMSIDENLYLWAYDNNINNHSQSNGILSPNTYMGKKNFRNGAGNFANESQMEDFCTFSPPSKRNIVSVGLVRPKKGIFRDSIKWCLVVTTDDEAILCAISNSSSPLEDSFGSSSLRLIPTQFIISTDSVPMITIKGTPDGRIFLGGYDGCLYEMQYEISSFTNSYSSSLTEKIIAGGKRTFEYAIPSMLLPGGISQTNNNEYQPHRKCRKLNHSNKTPTLTSVLPGFVQKLISFSDGPIVDICVDAERGSLYTLTSQGILYSHDLSSSHKTPGPLEIAHSLDLPKMAKNYLNAVTRGQMYPPHSSIRFPGGGSAASYGVGGMDGARSLLKASESESEGSSRNNESSSSSIGGVLNPISLHVISKKESKSLTLLAITGAGVRFYMSCLGSSSGNVKRIYLCHIRSPPNILDVLNDNENGTFSRDRNANMSYSIRPGYTTSSGRNKPCPNITATFYRYGTMMVAMNGTMLGTNSKSTIDYYSVDSRSSESKSNIKPVGDLILATTPDFASRPINASHTTLNGVRTLSGESTERKMNLSVFGGLSESIIIPSTTAIGGSKSRILPGGRVWEIASPSSFDILESEKNDRGMILYERLFWASTTPSDSELNVGVLPVCLSPTTELKRNKKMNIEPNTSSIMPKPNVGVISTTISLIGKIVQGKREDDALIDVNEFANKWQKTKFKLEDSPFATWYGTNVNSKNNIASENISLSRSSRRTQLPSKSSHIKLPQWLMNPEICSLQETSIHHLLTSSNVCPRQILALNSGGLHFFRRTSVLDQLATALHQGNSVTSSSVHSFFDSYGYDEGCAMALSLAVYSDNQLLTKRAIKAALAHAKHPRLLASSHLGPTSGSNTLTGTTSTSGIQIFLSGQQYDFYPSSLHDGLVKLTSRLFRPVWFKPAILVTPSRNKNRPSKVEFLLDEATLEEVRSPLHSLQSILRDVFTPAVSKVPGSHQKKVNPDDMEIDDNIDQNLITRALQFQNQSYKGVENDTTGSTRHLTHKEFEYHARLLEEKSIHNLYRLVSRAVQMLSLLNLLRRAHDLPSLPEVEWGLLHGLCFQQLVTHPKAHERVKSLLSALVTTNLGENYSFSSNPAFNNMEADKLALNLESQTYLYFSAGDRLTFQGFQTVKAAFALPDNSARRLELSAKAGKLLRMAAKHWESPSLVSGRIMHQENKNFDNVAMSTTSPVAKAANALMSIQNVGALVDICLVCASNFGGSVKGTSAEDDIALFASTAQNSSSILSWEVGLYHSGGNCNNEENNTLSQSSTTAVPSLSNQQIVVSGVDVTPLDARKSCYSILIYHLGELLRSQSSHQRQLGDVMLSVAANSHDELFQRTLYSFLLDENHVETLLRIQSPKVENWLMDDEKNMELLFRYYVFHGRHIEAADTMYARATSDSDTVSLDQRIQCLTRAVNALRSANEVASSQNNGNFIGRSEVEGNLNIAQHLESVQEQLEVSGLQKKILTAVIEQKLKPQNLNELRNKLLGVSELYNEYAAPLGLYRICLSIIQTCKTNDPSSIEILWRSVLSKEVPLKTESASAADILQRLRDGTPLEDMNEYESQGTFEDGKWISNVKETIISAGKELYGKGADYVFPLQLLVSNLEELRYTYESISTLDVDNSFESSSWPMQCLIEVGIGYPSILEAYINLYNTALHEGVKPEKRLFCLANIGELLKHWVLDACAGRNGRSSLPSINDLAGKQSKDSELQLTRALSAGLKSSIDAWKGALESFVGGDMRKTNDILAIFTDVEQALLVF